MAQWIRIRETVLFLVAILVFFHNVEAQFNPDNSYLEAHFGKPVTFTSRDSSFSLSIGGRIQSMAEARIDNNTKQNTVDFFIRRLRLNFAGNAMSKKFTYRIQLCFSQADVSANNSQVQNNLFLRDAMLFYSPNKHWRFGFGQTKLPGNRQRQVSSANLQFVDRSNTNALFTLDRDKGFWVTNTNQLGKKLILSNTIAITSGEGRINSDKSDGLCYSARTEILPMGEFKNNGDYIEADLFFEQRPKLALAFSYSYNDRTRRTLGQLGEYLYNNQTASIHYYGFDWMLKYKGLSFNGELYRRTSDDGVSRLNSDPTKLIYVYTGTGLLFQAGYLFTKKNEIALRYGSTTPDSKIKTYASRVNEYLLGYSHYFFRHNLKLQADLGLLKGPSQELFQGRFTGIVTF